MKDVQKKKAEQLVQDLGGKIQELKKLDGLVGSDKIKQLSDLGVAVAAIAVTLKKDLSLAELSGVVKEVCQIVDELAVVSLEIKSQAKSVKKKTSWLKKSIKGLVVLLISGVLASLIAGAVLILTLEIPLIDVLQWILGS